jgi:type I restriction enzyme S subunit
MELKPGYKQTEVGVIPEDWEVKKLGDCLSGTPDYGINAPAVPYTDSLPAYIRITDITEDGRFSSESLTSVEGADTERYFLNVGDLVFARTGASVGKSYLYDPGDGKLVFAGFLIRVKPNPTKLNPHFLAACVTTGSYWHWVKAMSMRSGQPGINGTQYAQLPIPVPPLPEQRAIVAALSDMGALIGGLDRLIAKKRAIKQAAVQQLLTSKKRLPGFSGEWEVKKLGEIGLFKKGRNIPKNQLSTQGEPCVIYGEIYTRYDCVVKELASFIPSEVAEQSTPIKSGDILFAGSGETAEEIGKCFAYIGTEKAYAGGDLIILSPKEADSTFLGYQLNSPMICKQKATLGQGSSVVHIYVSGLATVEVPLPPLSEQQAIAAVLSDMDAEIAALEQKRSKTRALKQGMMQELLTGKTRLI